MKVKVTDFLALVVIAGALCVVTCTHTVPNRFEVHSAGLAMACPNGVGACRFDIAARRFGTRLPICAPDESCDYLNLPWGGVLFRAKGHWANGAIGLLDRSDDVLLLRWVGQSTGLAETSGVGQDGLIWLCYDTPERAHCETAVYRRSNRPRTEAPPSSPYPPNCMFPRWSEITGAVCLMRAATGDEIWVQREESSHSRPVIKGVREIVPKGGAVFVLSIDGLGLYRTRNLQPVVLAGEVVSWCDSPRGLLVGLALLRDEGKRSRTGSVVLVTPDGDVETIRDCGDFLPGQIDWVSDSALVDEFGLGTRRIVKLPDIDHRTSGEMLWSGKHAGSQR